MISSKPNSLIVNIDNIPQTLKNEKRWVVWQYDFKPIAKKPWTKVPIKVFTRDKASTTNPSTWSRFDFAFHDYNTRKFDGIGFVICDGLCGVDLDHCVDNGIIKPWAQEIIDKFDSYTEFSASGNGIRIFAKGVNVAERNKKPIPTGDGDVEMYDTKSARYFTVTGNRVNGSSFTINERQSEIQWLADKYLKDDPKPEKQLNQKQITLREKSEYSAEDSEIIFKVTRFEDYNKMWSGDWSKYNSQSEADLALCGKIAYFVGDDIDRIDEIFRQSGLYRPKWERVDYRENTINSAIDSKDEYYDWDEETEFKQWTAATPQKQIQEYEPEWFTDGFLNVWTKHFLENGANETDVKSNIVKAAFDFKRVGKSITEAQQRLTKASGLDLREVTKTVSWCYSKA